MLLTSKSNLHYCPVDEEPDDIERRIEQQGPKQKPFSELGPLQKRRVSQKVFDTLKELSERRQISRAQLTGYLLKRYCPTLILIFTIFKPLKGWTGLRFYEFVVQFLFLTQPQYSRASYATNKVLAETGSRIEKGEVVAPLKRLEPEHCLWIMTTGDDLGKSQWR